MNEEKNANAKSIQFYKKESINHPSRYTKNGMEVIDIIEAFTIDLHGRDAFDIANSIKYILRFQEKGGIADLKKARWYLNDYIERNDQDETLYDN